MDSELEKKISAIVGEDKQDLVDFYTYLKNKAAELDERIAEIDEQYNNGEILTEKKQKEKRRLVAEAKSVQEDIDKFQKLVDFHEDFLAQKAELQENLQLLQKSSTPTDLKKEIKAKILKIFTSCNEVIIKDWKALYNYTDEEIAELEEKYPDLKLQKEELQKELEMAKKRDYDTKPIEEEIAEIEPEIEAIEDYHKRIIDISQIEQSLNLIAGKKIKVAEKNEISQKLLETFEQFGEAELAVQLDELNTIMILCTDFELTHENPENLEPEPEDPENENKKKKKSKKSKKAKEASEGKLAKASAWFKKHLPTCAKIGAGVLAVGMLVGTIVGLAQCNAKNKKTNKGSNDDYSIDSNIQDDPSNNLTNNNSDKNSEENKTSDVDSLYTLNVSKLIAKGYSEYAATLMDENFSQELIDAILKGAFNQAIENYAGVKDFKLEYLADYENARTIYNITAADAVDYVNRAYKIQENNFYPEASINDVVEVLMAINNKELMTQNNANLAQSFNTAFNVVTNNCLFKIPTDQDHKTVNSLQYFAKEGTDLDNFLTGLGEIIDGILNNPNDFNAKDEFYNYALAFGSSLNGFSNDLKALTENREFNNNAILKDYNDIYTAYEYFLKPFYPLGTPEINEKIVGTPNQNVYIDRIEKLRDLQILLNTAEEGVAKTVCGQAKTLE